MLFGNCKNFRVDLSNFVAAFHSCTDFHPFSGHRLANSFSCRGNPGNPGCGFFGCGSGPFCVGSLLFLLAKRKSGRKICVSSLCCLVFVYFVFSMDLPRCMKPRRFIPFAIYSTASLTEPSPRAKSAATEGKKYDQLIIWNDGSIKSKDVCFG